MRRREFLKHTLLGTSAIAFGVLPACSPARAAQLPFSPDYGPLYSAADKATGLPLIHLPEGFEYETFGWLGDRLSPAFAAPARHDGMAVVAAKGSKVVQVRNHAGTEPAGERGGRACGPAENSWLGVRSAGVRRGQRVTVDLRKTPSTCPPPMSRPPGNALRLAITGPWDNGGL